VSRLVARGDGKQIDTNSYTGSVRMSGVTDVDPFFGTTPNELTDLHKYLGTSAKAGKKKGISNSGLIEDVTASGTRELNVLQAFRLQRRRLAMSLDFANRVQWINTADTVDGLILTTGNMEHFVTGNDVWRSDLNIRGTGGDINIGGTFRGSSNINSTGNEGRLVSLRTKRALYATIDADVAIDSIIVGTSIGSPHIRTLGNLGLLQVGDSILTGSDVRTSKTLSSIIVPNTLEAGATVRAKKIEEQQIGTLEGDLVVG